MEQIEIGKTSTLLAYGLSFAKVLVARDNARDLDAETKDLGNEDQKFDRLASLDVLCVSRLQKLDQYLISTFAKILIYVFNSVIHWAH